MSLFDSITDMAKGMIGNSTEGGEKLQWIQVISQLLSQFGGMAGMQKHFQQNGLGALMNSWIGKGENLPINVAQIQNIFGGDRLNQMASQVGLSPSDFSGKISQYLPQVVDMLTPDGMVQNKADGFDLSDLMAIGKKLL